MAWKRTKGGYFTRPQHLTMCRMKHGGKTITEIAEAAGCSPNAVREILEKYKGRVHKYPERKNGKNHVKPTVELKEGAIVVVNGNKPEPPKTVDPEVELYVAEAAKRAQEEIEEFIKWREEGAKRQIGGVSFIHHLKHN